MDQFDAFQYFLTNLFLHNLVLVVLAGLLGVVLGRLLFGSRKVTLDQLREGLKRQEDRAKAAERELERLEARHAELLGRVEAGDTSFSPEQEEELKALRSEKGALEERVGGMAKELEDLVSRQKGLESEKEGLEAELAEVRESAGDDGARAEVEKLLVTMQGLEQRVTEAEDTARQELEGELEALRTENTRLSEELAEKVDVEILEKRIAEAVQEREQVEKASAVLRKEMRGLRNKVKETEQQESRVGELEQILKHAEERLTRSQATVAKESQVRASLEKMVEDLEWKLADASAERERLRDAVDGGGIEGAGHETEGDAGGAADALRGALGDEDDELGVDEGVVEPGEPEQEQEDDLTRIKGIGAVLEKKLRAVGVTSVRQIADWTDEELAEFSKKLRLRNRAERGDWRGQARQLCDGE